jgi:hypothetical protein
MTIHVNHQGSVKLVEDVYVNDNGTVKRVSQVYANDDGVVQRHHNELLYTETPTFTQFPTPETKIFLPPQSSAFWSYFGISGDGQWIYNQNRGAFYQDKVLDNNTHVYKSDDAGNWTELPKIPLTKLVVDPMFGTPVVSTNFDGSLLVISDVGVALVGAYAGSIEIEVLEREGDTFTNRGPYLFQLDRNRDELLGFVVHQLDDVFYEHGFYRTSEAVSKALYLRAWSKVNPVTFQRGPRKVLPGIPGAVDDNQSILTDQSTNSTRSRVVTTSYCVGGPDKDIYGSVHVAIWDGFVNTLLLDSFDLGTPFGESNTTVVTHVSIDPGPTPKKVVIQTEEIPDSTTLYYMHILDISNEGILSNHQKIQQFPGEPPLGTNHLRSYITLGGKFLIENFVTAHSSNFSQGMKSKIHTIETDNTLTPVAEQDMLGFSSSDTAGTYARLGNGGQIIAYVDNVANGKLQAEQNTAMQPHRSEIE